MSLNHEDLDIVNEDFDIVNKVEGKPGLDLEEGRYKVVGAVTVSPLFTRKSAGTTIAPAKGYKILDIETGKTLLVSKEEGVRLSAEGGTRNAYIVTRKREKKDKETGEVIKTEEAIYLQPYPARSEAFTQDDRLVTAFKLDENGRHKKPLELTITEEECSENLWRIIKEEYDKKLRGSRTKKSKRGSQQDHTQMMSDLKKALMKSSAVAVNPFNNRK
ncbi:MULTISPECIES: hypothetical protein [Bacillus]|uniref:hypothetical protein n=1 Tax=Bacillus TaxID=1386 RepID=UPI000E5087CA|nr:MULTISPECIES: hypothetical protein [Bacillus subtilis group]MCY8636466.1 hypothetical protein [Bacillus sp. S17B2]MBT3123236.1 hypothetical protein [Bacillus inaquosorum]MCB4337712.1 hypothetical protein [Bacillus subtilis]MCB5337303.1 hypothetical protein [Bacillus amyloliquefaciens]MCF7615347.1 hypothetical protein [Bacillus subtilis]